MTKAEFIELVEEIERGLPVEGWHLHGFGVWPLVRLQLFAANANASVLHDAVSGGALRNAAAVSTAYFAWARAIVQDRRNNAHGLAPADVVFLAYSAGRQPVIDGRRCNPLLAPYVELVRDAGKRAAVWEMCHDGDYNLPRSVPSSFIQAQLVSLRLASLFLHRPGRALPPLDGYPEFVARVQAAGLRNRYAMMEALERDAYFVRRAADWFKRRLAAVGPSHGIVADYGPRELAFCLACRELGIQSVELQHGVINEVHPAYAGWRSVPAGGYATRPSVFWCWDEEGERAIEGWATARHGTAAVAGGDPWREQWIGTDTQLVRTVDGQIEEIKRASGASRHILVTLDPTGPVVPAIVADAMRRSPADWCYWVRLHPVGQRQRLPEAARVLRSSGVRSAPVELSSQWPLPGLLRHMDAHVTPFWSTVVIEAEDFGVRSVACAERAREVFSRQLAEGTLQIALTHDDLVASIAQQIAGRQAPRAERRPDPVRTMAAILSPARLARGRLAS